MTGVRARHLVVATVLVLGSACSVSTGDDAVSTGDLEKEVSTQLKKLDVKPTDVTCPEELKAEVKATTRCTYVAEGLRIRTDVTVDTVDGGKVSFSLTRKIAAVGTDVLEQQVGTKLSEQKLTPSAVDCPEELVAKKGETASCTVIANDLKYTADVTATDVTDDNVPFDVTSVPPAIVPTNTLEAQVTQLLAGQVESGIDSVSCPDELVGTQGRSVDCAVEAEDGTSIDVVVTVTKADFLNVNFDIKEK